MFNDVDYILDLGPRNTTEEGKMFCTLSEQKIQNLYIIDILPLL